VQLAATVIFHIPSGSKLGLTQPLDAFHTSVVIGNMEYGFCSAGIYRAKPLASHEKLKSRTEVTDLGNSNVRPEEMLRTLSSHFRGGTYDLLRKNCNSFSDCALFLLLGTRLDPRYRRLERCAKAGQKKFALMDTLRMVGCTAYMKNPYTTCFKADDVINELSAKYDLENENHDHVVDSAEEAQFTDQDSSPAHGKDVCQAGMLVKTDEAD